MKTTAIAFAATALLIAGGCHKYEATKSATPYNATQPAASQNAATADPDELGRIGAQIKKHPKEADKILSEHGMTMASFEKAIRRVSSDPAASRQYRDAYKKGA